ncbi:MAG: hypothetical protein ACYDBH_24145, partial [Acidobacteriaceae bacterium]
PAKHHFYVAHPEYACLLLDGISNVAIHRARRPQARILGIRLLPEGLGARPTGAKQSHQE